MLAGLGEAGVVRLDSTVGLPAGRHARRGSAWPAVSIRRRPDAAGNARYTFSSDGTCSGGSDPNLVQTVVRAADCSGANGTCQAAVGRNVIHQLDQTALADDDAAPSDVWLCAPGPIPM